MVNMLSPQFQTPEHITGISVDLGSATDLSDYASVEDAFKHTEMSAGMVRSLRRQARRSPSMSPPPLPHPSFFTSENTPSTGNTGATTSGWEETVSVDLYAAVDIAHKGNRRVSSPSINGRGPDVYDRLVAEEPTSLSRYDKLQPPERPPREYLSKSFGDSLGEIPLNPMSASCPTHAHRVITPPQLPLEEYATIEDNGAMDGGGGGGGGEGQELATYATISAGQSAPRPPPHSHAHVPVTGQVQHLRTQAPQGREDHYSIVNNPPIFLSSSPLVPASRNRQQTEQGDMYSVTNSPTRGIGRKTGVGGRQGRIKGHCRIQSEDHILLHPTEANHLNYRSPLLTERPVTPEVSIYSTPNKKSEKSLRPSPPMKSKSLLKFGHSPVHNSRE